MTTWRELHHTYECFIATISLLLNFLVISLCMYKLAKAMKSYRWMIIGGSMVDIGYTIISFTIGMLPVDYSSSMIFMIDPPFSFIPETHTMAVVGTILHCIAIYALISSIVFQFLFRLNVFCLLNRFSVTQLCGLVAAYELWTILHCCNIAFACDRHDEPEITAALAQNPLFADTNVPPYLFNDSLELKMMLQLLDVQLIVGTGYGIIIYSAWRIERKLRQDLDQLQPSTLAAQKQLSRIMLFQAFLPLPTVLFPVGLACFLPMIGITWNYLPVFINLTISILPICNPLVILITIPSFRRTIFFYLCGARSSSIASTSAGFSKNQKSNPASDQKTTEVA